MRTRTDRDAALASSGLGAQTVWCKVEVDRTKAGAWVDVTNWNGVDFLQGLQYGENIDAPVWSASITLKAWAKDNPSLSLSPMMTGSLLNVGGVLLTPSNPIRISTSTVGLDEPAGTYNKVFEGQIDKWSHSNGVITLDCRGKLGQLQDRFCETGRSYGDADPSTATAADLEEVIQNIMDDHVNTTPSAARTSPLSGRGTDGVPWQLYGPNGTAATPYPVADNTGAAVRINDIEKMPVAQAILQQAAGIAYNLRMRWHEGSGIDDFVLVFEAPDRTASTAVLTFDPTTGQARINSSELDIQHVRNVIKIGYQKGGGATLWYEPEDPTSISKYGRRPMEINLGNTSQVDTLAEATTMGDGVLNDMKDPIVTASVSVPYLWYLQLGDLIAIDPDGIHFDAQQKLAVRSRMNFIQQGGAARTDMVLHGKPQSGVERHLTTHRKHLPLPRSVDVPFNWGSSMHTNGNFAADRG